jgi:hypothetical protein
MFRYATHQQLVTRNEQLGISKQQLVNSNQEFALFPSYYLLITELTKEAPDAI